MTTTVLDWREGIHGWGVDFATNNDFRLVNREIRPRLTWTKESVEYGLCLTRLSAMGGRGVKEITEMAK